MRKTFAKIVAIIAMTVIMLAGNSALAYTGDGYTIDMPSTYTSGGSNMWVNSSSSASVNIQILANSAGETVSQSTLQETMDSLKSAYAGITIEKSEITKLNGMDAIHLVSNVSGMYIEQYAVTTSSKIYVLTIGAMDKSYLSSSEATGIIGSFNVTGATSSSSTGTSTTTNNTINNTTNNTTNTSNVISSTSNTSDNKSNNKYVDDDDDDEDEDEDEKSSKKSKSSKSDDDEDSDKTWVIVAIVAGVIVFALIAIIIIVAIVVSGKKKQQY